MRPVARRVRRSTAVGAAIAAGAVAFTAAVPAHAADRTVTFADDGDTRNYTPSAVTINPGDTVTFSGSFKDHPLVWPSGDFSREATGDSRTYAFPRGGTYAFLCDFHPNMLGTVVVAGNKTAAPVFAVSPDPPTAGAVTTFDAGATRDPDGTVSTYEWDLDGDGRFETKGASPTVTRTYASAGTIKVGLRYVDDGHDTSAVTTREITVSTAPAPGGGTPVPGPGGGGTPPAGSTPPAGGATPPTGGTTPPARDRRAPTARVSAATTRGVKLVAGVARLGLTVDERSTVTANVRRGAVVVGRGTAKLTRVGAGAVKVKLTAAGLRAVRQKGRVSVALTLVVRDAAGNARTLRRQLTLKK
ncbi:hypothetical protein DSM112329_01189 [Paraconexibacter sp. AEG42_29]|uniref:PKD domain-containing protein n=1 Tax=Paraconexibacter sp. AEG42_29 TaxID=2997339 RepID=A0AAU7AS87_9ACTN